MAVELHGWQEDAHQLWLQGHRQGAIDRLLERINTVSTAVPPPLGLQLAYYIFLLGDLAGAETALRRLLAQHPDDVEILENLAVILSRQRGRMPEALRLYQQVIARRPDSANAWDGLAHVCSKLQRLEQARQAGERSLALKTAAAVPLPGWRPPANLPRDHLKRPGAADRIDCICFSIWGHHPRYLRGALRNALLIPELYPGWRARFHLDDTVPGDFVALLQQLCVQIRRMLAGQSLRQKLCWRFLVANDPGVGRFLVRDCDSVVSQREVQSVRVWLASDHWFHVMRDWWTHTDPILAGMWGGIAGVLPDLQRLLTSYTPAAHETANVDQWFLRDVLWGSIRHHALIHDRCFCSEGSNPWPDPDPPGVLHVGQDECAVRRPYQDAWLGAWLERHPYLQRQQQDVDTTSPPRPIAPDP